MIELQDERASRSHTLSSVLAGCVLFATAGCQAGPATRFPEPPTLISAETMWHLQLSDESGPAVQRPELPELPRLLGSPGTRADQAAQPQHGELSLEQVLLAVEQHSPLILAALEEIEIAGGGELAAQGAFDTLLSSRSGFELMGFYENQRMDLGLEQPTQLWGSTVSGGYRAGLGDFADYDGKAKTNDGGEFRLGVSVPLLQGGRIDARRVAIWRARLETDRAQASVVRKRLEVTAKAAQSYWTWVGAGVKRSIAARLLALAENRQEQVRAAVEEGQLAQLALLENRRLIVERQSNLLSAERSLQRAAILLSLFLRDAQGNPVVASESALPADFPTPRGPEKSLLPNAATIALQRRPDLLGIELELEQLELQRDLFDNQRLAKLDFGVFASQDIGEAVDSPDDKGQFELEALVKLELPLQRRTPRGKLRATKGKIMKLRHEYRYASDRVVSEVDDAASAITLSWSRLAQARENVALAEELEVAERLQLELGESDLFRVNLREQQSAFASASLVEVLSDHFQALAKYRAVIGIPYDEVVRGEAIGSPSAAEVAPQR